MSEAENKTDDWSLVTVEESVPILEIRDDKVEKEDEQKLTKMVSVHDPFESLLLMAAYGLKPIGILKDGLDSRAVFEYTDMARAALWRWGKAFDNQLDMDDKGEYVAGDSISLLAESLVHMLYADQREAFHMLNDQSIKIAKIREKAKKREDRQ